MPIIRRNNCVCVTLGTCYSVWMTVWYAGAYAPAHQTVVHTDVAAHQTAIHTEYILSENLKFTLSQCTK